MSTEVRIEWRVETDQTLDDFGTDEAHAREWLAETVDHPDWMPARLLRRTVTVHTADWEQVGDEVSP